MEFPITRIEANVKWKMENIADRVIDAAFRPMRPGI